MLVVDYEKLRGVAWGQGPKIAKALGLKRAQCSKKINGHAALTIADLNAIERATGINLREFVRFEDLPGSNGEGSH